MRVEISVGGPLQLPSDFFFSEPEAHKYDETGLPSSFNDLHVSTSTALRLQLCTAVLAFDFFFFFNTDAEDFNSILHGCRASIFLLGAGLRQLKLSPLS